MSATVSHDEPARSANSDDVAFAAETMETFARLRSALADVIIGQPRVIDELLIAILAGGHCLLQGVPGLAKSLLASSVSATMDLTFKRIQFTPDLMPSDITGTEVLQEDPETGRRRFEFLPGPIFCNLLLADEINRTPPKTQAALLQAMQEQEVSAGNRTMPLAPPFIVLATQNPIEQEGTYPLPEAQLDRFMFMITIGYPSREEELQVLQRTTGTVANSLQPILGREQLIRMQALTRRVPISEPAATYALDLVRMTRPAEPGASDFVRSWLSWGAGTRAGQFLILGGKARALLQGRLHVTLDDIEAVAFPVLRHRIIPNFAANAEGVTAEQIIQKLLTLLPRGKHDRLL
jgi:MoxR-like ATPase